MEDEDFLTGRNCFCNNSLSINNRIFCDDCIEEFEDRLICSGILEELAYSGELSEEQVLEYAFRIIRIILNN